MPLPRKIAPRPKSFNCPQCGAPVDVRVPARAMSVVCPSCGSILDTSTPTVSLLHAYQQKARITPRIPLGKRAVLQGVKGEVVGFMRRSASSEGEFFHWDEYLIYNPYYGYRFLAETVTGWTLTQLTTAVPRHPREYKNGVVHDRRHYALSEWYDAKVTYVLGEFYWQVEIGETVTCYDFGTGSLLLVGEVMPDEYTWAIGRKIDAAEVWRAFGLDSETPDYEEEAGDVEAASNPWVTAIVIVVVIVVILVLISSDVDIGGSFFGGK